jgi:hypothetical protein
MFSIKAAAIAFVAALESVSGVNIAVLDRIDDPAEFWVRTAAILCNKTGDAFCEKDVRFMTANTELSGYSQIIEYKNEAGVTKRVCALLPPVDDIDPSYVAEAFTGSFAVSSQYPSSLSAAWLYMYHAAHCLDSTFTGNEEGRAAAFATLGLGILQGDPTFAPGVNLGQSMRIASMIKNDAAYWAAGTSERILLDYWKGQAAGVLRSKYGCNANVLKGTTINTPSVARDKQLKIGEDCATAAGSSTQSSGVVSDANLWIWMYGNGGIGAPPVEYQPAAMFSDFRTAAKYTLETAIQLAK